MPAIPWRNLSPIEPDRAYLVMASRLPLKTHRRIPKFMRLTHVVARQLQRTPGLVGYGLLARPIAKTFWTLSAWEDRQALAAFTRTMPHLQVMKDLQPHMMSTTKFTQWTIPGSSFPVSWVDAFAQLDQEDAVA